MTTGLAQHWPHWRGPTHDGVSLEKGLPDTWSATCASSGDARAAARGSRAGRRGSPSRGWRGRDPTRSAAAAPGRQQLRRPAAGAHGLRQHRDQGHLLETAVARLQRIDADHLGRDDLPQRRDRNQHRRPRAVGDRSQQAVGDVEAAARRRQQHAAQAEHVDAVADHRRQIRVGDDRRRHPQGVRLRRQGDLDARHPGRLRQVRLELGLRQYAAVEGGCALRAGPARHEDRRSVLHPEDRQDERQDDLARRASESRRATNRRMPTSRRRGSKPTAARN